jgi:gluconolactonase
VTDSGILISDWLQDGDIRPDYATAAFDGRIYQVNPLARTGRVLANGLRFANGIAFGPEGHLYVNEMISGDVVRLRFDHGSPSSELEHFGNVMALGWDGGFRGPDGMGFGADGRLYCTVFGEGCIAILGPDGNVEGRILTEGRRPTNLAWGSEGDRRIFVTEIELGRIEIHDTGTPGLPLYYGDKEPLAL